MNNDAYDNNDTPAEWFQLNGSGSNMNVALFGSNFFVQGETSGGGTVSNSYLWQDSTSPAAQASMYLCCENGNGPGIPGGGNCYDVPNVTNQVVNAAPSNTFVTNSLTQLRGLRRALPVNYPSGSTDVKMYRVMVANAAQNCVALDISRPAGFQCAAPTFNPPAAVYSSAQTVTISTGTGGASIHYTTNGTTPSNTVGTLYSSPVTIGLTGTLQAIAYDSGYDPSPVTAGYYTIGTLKGWVENSLPAGATAAAQNDAWNWITSNPTPYIGTECWQTNNVSGEHQIYFTGATATMSVGSNDTLFCYVYLNPGSPPEEVMLQWTANGSTWYRAFWGPTTDILGMGTCTYIGPLPAAGQWACLSVPATLLGVGGMTMNGMAYSLYNGQAAFDYAGTCTPGSICAAPTFNPAAGAYGPAQSVTISTTTGGASINYTTNGTTPSSTVGTLYSSPVNINSSCTLQAIAYESGDTNSSVSSGVYTINGACAAPTFNPAAGAYGPAQSVTISTTTGGASINYTTNGTTPSSTVGTLYSSPVNISSSCTLQAIAYENGYTNSSVTSGVYTINGACAAPTFNPAAGSYSSAQTVTISTTTSGASINYTTNGTTPSSTVGTAYSSPVTISSTCTLEAIAYKSGYSNSTVTSGSYTINSSGSQTIWVENSLPAGATAYAQNGDAWNWITSNPTPYQGTECWQTDNISGTHQLYFTGATTTMTVGSNATLFCYVYLNPSSPPEEVMLQWTTNGSTWYRAYWGSTNYLSGYGSATQIGALPATGQWVCLTVPASTLGVGGLTMTGMAFSLQNGQAAFDYAGDYTTGLTCAAPTFSPAAGTYSSAQSVIISTTTGGASINYTTNGTTPSSSVGTLYSTPVNIGSTATLEAIAYLSGDTNSSVTSGVYTITSTCAAPTFNPAPGAYGPAQTVTISTTTGGASINYTTNGTAPSSSVGTLYSSPVTIGSTATLEAIAFESGYTPSSVTSGVYTINGACATPTFTPAAGTYSSAQSVTISTTTSGASINYTTNGTTPSSTVGTAYTSPVAISATSTLQAIAYKTGYSNSTVASGVYTISSSGISSLQVNCGGAAVSGTNWVADEDYGSGTSTASVSNSINTSGVTNPAPQAVYQCCRYATTSGTNFTYTITGLIDNGQYTVRLHFAENWFNGSGQREFNVLINGTQVLTNFDIYATAGAEFTAVVEQFTATANSSGTITINFNSTVNSALVSGIEVLSNTLCLAPTFTPAAGTYESAQSVTISTTTGGASINYTTNGTTPSSSVGTLYSTPVNLSSSCTLQAIAFETGYTSSAVTSGTYTIYSIAAQINCGGSAVSGTNWVADEDYGSGTSTASVSNTITTTGVTNPAPQAVYQSCRYATTAGTNFSYTITGLTDNAAYTVRLHFAENWYGSAGQREFNVLINSTQVLTDFDIYATAGAEFAAVVEQFQTTASSTGTITLNFNSVVNSALISGIEILSP